MLQGHCNDAEWVLQDGAGTWEGCHRDAGGCRRQDTFPRLSDKQRVFGSQIDSN